MSTINPSRRALRTTRTTAAKDNENANARPSRITSRAKPLSTVSNAATTAGAAGSKAKNGTSGDLKADHPAAKRKREVLGEVTGLSTNNRLVAGKGKEKEAAKKFDGVVINKSKTITVRQPLRTVAGTRQNNKTVPAAKGDGLEDIKEQHDDNAMVIDPPAQAVLPSLTIRRSLLPEDQVPHATRRSDTHRRISSRSARVEPQADDDDETDRVFKKRRTSSEAPEEDPRAVEEARMLAEKEALASKVEEQLSAFEEEPEFEPEGEDWEDLDAEDAEDPLMVSEYVVEIFKYLKDIEVTTMPNPHYMENQKELGWPMRGILSDWLVQLHASFRLLPETLFLCINIIDRFLSARVVSLAKLQLVGVTSMFIAAKVEEIMAPSVLDLLDRTDGTYTQSEIFMAERYVLKTLDWNLSYPNPVHYLRRISKADEYNVKVRTLAKYLLEIECLEWRLIAAPPSLTAAAAMWLSRMMLGSEKWNANLAHYSSYAESALIPTANLMINYILKPIRHEAFHKKYAHKKYNKVSVYARSWATSRWEEGTQVKLAQELPALKEEIRAARIEEELLEQAEESRIAVGRTKDEKTRA